MLRPLSTRRSGFVEALDYRCHGSDPYISFLTSVFDSALQPDMVLVEKASAEKESLPFEASNLDDTPATTISPKLKEAISALIVHTPLALAQPESANLMVFSI